MRHLAKPRDASFFSVFFNPYRYGVLTLKTMLLPDDRFSRLPKL